MYAPGLWQVWGAATRATAEALNGVAEYLHRRGGSLTLVGVQPAVATKIAVHGLSRLSASAARRQEQFS